MKDLFGFTPPNKLCSNLSQKPGTLKETKVMVCDSQDEFTYIWNCGMLFDMAKVEPGKARHIFTNGNMDLTSFICWLCNIYGGMRRVLVSAWSFGLADVIALRRLSENNDIEILDILASDMHPKKHKHDHQLILQMRQEGLVRGYYVTDNHSKFILLEAKDGTKLVMTSSANCTLYPCIEISVLTNSSILYDQYEKNLDIQPFETNETPNGNNNEETEKEHRVLLGD